MGSNPLNYTGPTGAAIVPRYQDGRGTKAPLKLNLNRETAAKSLSIIGTGGGAIATCLTTVGAGCAIAGGGALLNIAANALSDETDVIAPRYAATAAFEAAAIFAAIAGSLLSCAIAAATGVAVFVTWQPRS